MTGHAVRLWAALALGLVFAAMVPSVAAAQTVAQAGCAGIYRMTTKVSGDTQLIYTLHLVADASGKRSGPAELHVEREGTIAANQQNGRDFGSVATVYLQRATKVIHKGRWESSGGDKVTVSLESIEGRKDPAKFSGSVLDNILTLTCENRGMYGAGVAFRMERGNLTPTKTNPFDDSLKAGGGDKGPITPRDVAGTYIFTARREIGGVPVEIEYVLVLRDNGDAELTAKRKEKPKRDGPTGAYFGSLATVYLQDREQISHTGKWQLSGDKVLMELVTIQGRTDKAKFIGTAKRGTVDLRCENAGMYGSFTYTMVRKTYDLK